MKRLSCEVCGSNDIIKQDGVFVCEACGCKYSLDEVRKMVIEGVVEVTGSVSVEGEVNVAGIANIDSLFKRAQVFYESEEYDKAEEYCDRVLDIDPGHEKAQELYNKIHIRPKLGEVYTGKVVRVFHLYAVVSLAPNVEGIVPISRLANYRVERITDIVNVGDEIKCKVFDIDSQGRIALERITD